MNTAKKFNLWMGIALLILCFFIIFVVYPLILILYKRDRSGIIKTDAGLFY